MENNHNFILVNNFNSWDTNYHLIDVNECIDYLLDIGDVWEELDYLEITDITKAEFETLFNLAWKTEPQNEAIFGGILKEY